MDVESVSRLRRAISRLARQLNAESTDEGLTPSQASVLGQISASGPLGIRELGEREGLNPTMLSRVIGKLEEAGLITRTPHPDDLRAALVAATAKGRRLSQQIRARRNESMAACVASLSETDAKALAGALAALEALEEAMRHRR